MVARLGGRRSGREGDVMATKRRKPAKAAKTTRKRAAKDLAPKKDVKGGMLSSIRKTYE
jgi:hypothetical protein